MRFHFFSVLCPLLLLLSGCAGCSAPAEETPPAQRQLFAMDTLMSLTVYGPQGEAAVQAAQQELSRLDGLLSRTDPDSQISQLNARAGDGTWVPLEPETAGVLEFAQQAAQLLPGAFDCTIAPVMDAWGFTQQECRVPAPAQLERSLSLVDSAALLVDPSVPAARLERADMAVDLGAVAKGFAAGRAAKAVLDAGASSALLDLGRNVTVLGDGPSGPFWRVAVIDPQDAGRYLGVVAMRDQTASTSGGYERYFEQDGVRYHHIIDPKTGYPADSGLLSVTVISSDPQLADALSTALFVAGKDSALDFWRGREDFELILCSAGGTVTVTEGLEDHFQFQGDAYGYTCETARR